MKSSYLLIVLGVYAAACVLFIVLNLLRSDRRGAAAAAVSVPLCAALGGVFAKGFYVLLMGEWNTLCPARCSAGRGPADGGSGAGFPRHRPFH